MSEKRVVLAGEEKGKRKRETRVEKSTDEMAERLPPPERVRYETKKRIFLTILSRISDLTVSRDLTDKIMMKYHLFKDSPEEEDRLIREEIDKYEQTDRRIYTKFLGKVGDVSHVESLKENIMKKYQEFKDSPEEEDKLIREEMDRYDAEMSTGTVDAFDDLFSQLENTEDTPDEPGGAQLKNKRSKKRKKRKSKKRKSKRKVSKRKKKKKKHH